MSGWLKKMLGINEPERIAPGSLPIEGKMPDFTGIAGWINSEPLTKEELRDKVVLIDFWTYSCVNCVRTLPHLIAWHQNYADRGLVIVGVHSPEFEFEAERANVESAVKKFGIEYPVALDSDRATWNAYRNRYWPAHYFVDRAGKIRYHHFGEGGYRHSEQVIRTLLQEDGGELPIWTDTDAADRLDVRDVGSPETYLGYDRQDLLGSPESVLLDDVRHYSIPKTPALNVFYLEGEWEIRGEYVMPRSAGARLVYRYRGAEVNLVLECGSAGVREQCVMEVLLDGEPLSEKSLGEDVKMVDGKSVVEVSEARMYRLVNTDGYSDEHLLELEFPKPGIKCFAFTFG